MTSPPSALKINTACCQDVEESYYIGYKLLIENKTDKYILVSTDNTSVDGFVVIDDGDNRFDWVTSYVAAEPLTTCHYHGLIECPEVIDGSDAPLFITLNLNGSTYRYDIR